MPEVSVVIPARNEEAFIRAAVESVLAQTHTDLEVIVVDGMSEDNTVSIVEALAEADPRVRLVENPDRITPKAMNAGLHAARGTWLVRVDAHATVPPDYVERAISHLRSEKWGGVGGRKDGVGITSAGRAIAAAMASPFGVGNSVYHHGMETQTVDHIPFGAYPIALARELGGWDERLRVNQDFEFDWRIRQAGKDLLFDPALRIDWICRQSTKDLLKQYFRYGRGKVRVAALHPRSMSWRHVIPPAAVLWIALALVLLPFKPLWALAALAPYLAVVVLAAARTARPESRSRSPARDLSRDAPRLGRRLLARTDRRRTRRHQDATNGEGLNGRHCGTLPRRLAVVPHRLACDFVGADAARLEMASPSVEECRRHHR